MSVLDVCREIPQAALYAMLRKYMMRVIDVEGCSFIEDGMAHGFDRSGLSFTPTERALLLALESEIREGVA